MKNGYYGFMCWVFGIVAILAIALGAMILIGDFSFSSGSTNNEETEQEVTSTEPEQNPDLNPDENPDGDAEDAFFVESGNNLSFRF